MPTEHEYKYVISMDFANNYPEDQLRVMCDEDQFIRQGYLAFSKGMTTRIRYLKTEKKSQWFLTFKQKVGERVIEIEKKISDRDGSDLWDICVGRLNKERFVFKDGEIKWEVDFFRKGGLLYFILAEVELSEGMPPPEKAPDFLAPFIIYNVPLTDDRFSNKRLGDAEYAHRLYLDISTLGESHDQKFKEE